MGVTWCTYIDGHIDWQIHGSLTADASHILRELMHLSLDLAAALVQFIMGLAALIFFSARR